MKRDFNEIFSFSAKKNGVVQKLASSPASVRVRNTAVAPPPSPRKPTPLRVPAQRPNTLPTNNKGKNQAMIVFF